MSDPGEQDSETVSTLFDKGLKNYHELCNTMDPSNSSEYQVCSLTYKKCHKLDLTKSTSF